MSQEADGQPLLCAFDLGLLSNISRTSPQNTSGEILYQALAIHGFFQHGPVYDIILWTHGRTETHISVGAGRGLRVRILALPLSHCLEAQFSHL